MFFIGFLAWKNDLDQMGSNIDQKIRKFAKDKNEKSVFTGLFGLETLFGLDGWRIYWSKNMEICKRQKMPKSVFISFRLGDMIWTSDIGPKIRKFSKDKKCVLLAFRLGKTI